MTTCDGFQEMAERRLHGALGADDSAALDAHLAGCGECSEFVRFATLSEDALRGRTLGTDSGGGAAGGDDGAQWHEGFRSRLDRDRRRFGKGALVVAAITLLHGWSRGWGRLARRLDAVEPSRHPPPPRARARGDRRVSGPLDPAAETALVSRVVGGAPTERDDAFAALYDALRGQVFGVCVNVTGNAADAEDAVQETFVAVHDALPRFAGRSRLSTWVHRIAIRSALRVGSRRHAPGARAADVTVPAAGARGVIVRVGR